MTYSHAWPQTPAVGGFVHRDHGVCTQHRPRSNIAWAPGFQVSLAMLRIRHVCCGRDDPASGSFEEDEAIP